MINLRIVIFSVLFLISLFSGIAVYLITLGLGFIGLSYIIVYVGAVSILFLFILMLINIRISELQNNTNNSIPLSIIIGIYLHFILFILLPFEIMIIKNINDYSLINLLINNYLNLYIEGNFSTNYGYKSILSGIFYIGNNTISFVSSIAWDANMATDNSHITNIGNVLYTNYNLWLILTSLILLLAMVGTIVIVISPKEEGRKYI